MTTNLVNNGDFESSGGSLTSWQFTSSGSGVSGDSEDITITNNYCSIATTESVYQNVPVSANESYALTFDSRGVVNGTVALMLTNSNTTYWSSPFNGARNTDWTEENFAFSVDPAWAGPFVLHFHAEYSATGTDSVEIDNVVLTQN
ncbi:hypothetical protein [Enterobacter sp. 22452]|uniref:hypothetical protein n=1 Tax=Enterobacter TaxID=547 RepID=UPI003F867D50